MLGHLIHFLEGLESGHVGTVHDKVKVQSYYSMNYTVSWVIQQR